MSFLPSPCLLDKRITGVENLNRLGHDVGTNGRKEWGCFKLYVKCVFKLFVD